MPWYSKCMKLFSRLPHFSGKLFWGIFLSIFVYRYFFMYFYISWEPFSLVTLFLLGITKELNALHKLFYNISPLLGAILRYFKNYFGVCSSVLESCSTFYLMKFCITLTVNTLRKTSLHVPLCWGRYMQYFWAYFRYISWEHISIEKLKRFPWYFSRMSWYYCVVTKLKVQLTFPQPLTFF